MHIQLVQTFGSWLSNERPCPSNATGCTQNPNRLSLANAPAIHAGQNGEYLLCRIYVSCAFMVCIHVSLYVYMYVCISISALDLCMCSVWPFLRECDVWFSQLMWIWPLVFDHLYFAASCEFDYLYFAEFDQLYFMAAYVNLTNCILLQRMWIWPIWTKTCCTRSIASHETWNIPPTTTPSQR